MEQAFEVLWPWIVPHGVDDFLRTAAVAEAPAGHRIRLRHAVDRDDAVVELRRGGEQRAERLGAPPDLFVHVVGADDDARVIQQHVGQRAPFGARVRGAGRVAGRVDEQQARLRRDRRFELARRHLVALRGRAVRRDGQAVREQHHVRVAHPVRRRDHGLVARIEHRHAEVVDSLLGARAHENLVALVRDLIVAS